MQKNMFSRPTDSNFSGYVIGNKDGFLGLKAEMKWLQRNDLTQLDNDVRYTAQRNNLI